MPDRKAFAGSVATTDRLVRTMIYLAGVPLIDAVRMMSLTPARILHIDKEKGSLEIGKDADIVIYDKDKDFTISVNNMHSDCDHTIWEGKKLHGYPVQTYLRGSLVYDNGDFVGTPGNGKYVKRSTSK